MGTKYLLAKALLHDMTDSWGNPIDDYELTNGVLEVMLEEAHKSELQAETVIAILRAFGAMES